MSDQGEGRGRDRPPLRGDEAELFREFNGQFVRTVQWRTNAPREVVDDACGFAWQQFMRHQPDRDRNWRAWLLTTAGGRLLLVPSVSADSATNRAPRSMGFRHLSPRRTLLGSTCLILLTS